MKKLLITVMTCLMLVVCITPVIANEGEVPAETGYVFGTEVNGDVNENETSEVMTTFTVSKATALTLDVESTDALVVARIYDVNHNLVDEIETSEDVDGVVLVFDIAQGTYTIEVFGIKGTGSFSYRLTEVDFDGDGNEKSLVSSGETLPTQKPKAKRPEINGRPKRGIVPVGYDPRELAINSGKQTYAGWLVDSDMYMPPYFIYEMYPGEIHDLVDDLGDWDWDSYGEFYTFWPEGTTFHSDTQSVVSISSTGVLTAHALGYSEIKVVIYGTEYIVDVMVGNVYLIPDNDILYDHWTEAWVNEKFTVSLKGKDSHLPTTYISTDPTIVKVDKKTGKATALKPGTASIVAERGNYSDILEVYVPKPELVLVGTVFVGVEREVYLHGIVGKEKWTSSNKSIVSVDSKGMIMPLAKGTATITAEVGSYKLKRRINVKANSITLPFNPIVNSYPAGILPTLVPSKLYYSGRTLKLEAYAMNNSPFKLTKFKYLKLHVFLSEYDSTEEWFEHLAFKNFENIQLDIKAYKSKKIVFSFTGQATYRPGYELPWLDLSEEYVNLLIADYDLSYTNN